MIRDPRMICLIDEFWRRCEAAQGDERATLNLVSSVRKSLGLTGDELVGLMEKGGYIAKSEPTDPVPGPMRKLPLVDALRAVSVEIVGDSLGRQLRCLRCGGIWQPGFPAGRADRLPKNGWKCPAGCNASASFPEVDTGELTYNPLSEYS